MATCPKCRNRFADDASVCPNDGEPLLEDAAFESIASSDLEPGAQVGEYVVEGKLGEGAFGAVFKAVHPLIGKQVAIKVLSRQYSSEPLFLSRFIAEARAVNQIRHRNIIDIFSFGQLSDGRHYYVMELLAGVTLDAYLAARGRLDIGEALLILRPLARALDAAHAKGIAHRDLKPANVFISVDEDGRPFPKLLDFGIAKLLSEEPRAHKTRTGAAMGTPQYMSPEQCNGTNVDHRTDIYAFGVMAFQLLTGTLPFHAASFMKLMLKHMTEKPPVPSSVCPSLKATFDAPLLAMLEKEADARPQTLGAATKALEEAALKAGITLPTTTNPDLHELSKSGGHRLTPAPLPTPAPAHTDLGNAPTLPSPSSNPQLSAELAAVLETPKKRNYPVVAAAALGVLLLGGIVARSFDPTGEATGAGDQAAPMQAAPAEPAKPPEPANPAEAARPAEPPPATPAAQEVKLVIQTAPPGTEVLGADGKVLGTAPGVIVFARGEAAVKLRFEAKGYQGRPFEFLPLADLTLPSVELAQQRVDKPVKPAGAKKKKPGGKKSTLNDLEEAFE